MSDYHDKMMKFLKEKDNWVTLREIVDETGIHMSRVTSLLNSALKYNLVLRLEGVNDKGKRRLNKWRIAY